MWNPRWGLFVRLLLEPRWSQKRRCQLRMYSCPLLARLSRSLAHLWSHHSAEIVRLLFAELEGRDGCVIVSPWEEGMQSRR